MCKHVRTNALFTKLHICDGVLRSSTHTSHPTWMHTNRPRTEQHSRTPIILVFSLDNNTHTHTDSNLHSIGIILQLHQCMMRIAVALDQNYKWKIVGRVLHCGTIILCVRDAFNVRVCVLNWPLCVVTEQHLPRMPCKHIVNISDCGSPNARRNRHDCARIKHFVK